MRRAVLALLLAAGTITIAAPPAQAADTDLLAGRAYTASVAAAAAYPDTGGTELTDGTSAAALLADAAWQGRNGAASHQFTADLGTTSKVGSHSATFFQYTSAGILLPTQVTYQDSLDGTTWSTACTVPQQSATGTTTKAYACTPASPRTARFVRMVVTSQAATWSFVTEWDAMGSSACGTAPHLSGSFLQPALGDTWSTAQWATELGYLNRACIGELALQWTADSKAKTTVYPTSLPGYTKSTTNDVVERTLAAADAAGTKVYLGLQVNDDWWHKFAGDTAWLNGEAATANALASDLWSKYGSHPSLTGWYLSFEVDNWNFTTQAGQDAMAAFYTTVADHLHTLTPGKKVVISPFFNTAGGLTATQWQGMWTSILSQSPIDVIALQDGVGAGHASTGQLSDWFAATKNAISAARPSTQLWADTETFNLDFQPMGVKDVVADMQAVQASVSKYWSFSYDHYQSPLQVPAMYDTTYRDYLATGAVESTAPTTPTGLTATAASPLRVDLSWTAATDAVGVAGYRVTRNGSLVKTLYGTATSFADAGLDPSTAYTYSVAAFDAAGNVSGSGAPASATTPAAPSNPVNLAAGKPYTSSMAADAAYADAGGELTDGAYGTTVYSDAAWQGRNTAAAHSFTVDLGATKAVKELSSDWLQVKGVYIFLPKKVTYALSADNVTFTTVGTVDAPAVAATDQSRKYRLLGLSANARYVRVTVEPASSAWSLTDEIEVRSTTP
ncbi:DUF4434 domain-containing protein [Nonomuraea sp. NPDC049152]|uniref:DUF4434 domain-containing protein n=1 Tax=Nonomuraea sp. NPDC049152 TaxID=3154350 RepID=UPI003401B905